MAPLHARLWLWIRVVRGLLASSEDTKNPVKKPFFLLGCVRRRRTGFTRLLLRVHPGRSLCRRILSLAKEFPEPALAGLRALTAVKLAILGRFAAGDKVFGRDFRARRSSELAASRIDGFLNNACRRLESLCVLILR